MSVGCDDPTHHDPPLKVPISGECGLVAHAHCTGRLFTYDAPDGLRGHRPPRLLRLPFSTRSCVRIGLSSFNDRELADRHSEASIAFVAWKRRGDHRAIRA